MPITKLPMKFNVLLGIAVLLIVAWIILRVALAITGLLLHVLWIAAVIMLIGWAWGKVRGYRAR